jgi:dihydrodipicolinate synthase/N-acetylneuraminate lyase
MAHVLEGVWPALVTPTDADNRVNVSVLRQLVDYLIDKGVHGFYVGGSTGDGIFMPVEQRRVLAETVLAHVAGRVPVVVHVGATASDDAVALARHARDWGAAGVSSIIPPLYDHLESLYEYYRVIAAAVPDLPVLAYLLDPTIDSIALMRRLMAVPNVAGVKYTGANMYEFRRIVDLRSGQWSIFSGMDEQAIYGCMMGATGLIGSTLNFMPGVYLHIYRCVQTGDYPQAQALQIKANQVIACMNEVGFKGALKTVMTDLLRMDTGRPYLPALPLTHTQQCALRESLAKTDFDRLTAL